MELINYSYNQMKQSNKTIYEFYYRSDVDCWEVHTKDMFAYNVLMFMEDKKINSLFDLILKSYTQGEYKVYTLMFNV